MLNCQIKTTIKVHILHRHVEIDTFAWSFLVSNTESESEMFSEIRPNRGSQKYASYFTWQVENKLFKASVLWMNNSRIH